MFVGVFVSMTCGGSVTVTPVMTEGMTEGWFSSSKPSSVVDTS